MGGQNELYKELGLLGLTENMNIFQLLNFLSMLF